MSTPIVNKQASLTGLSLKLSTALKAAQSLPAKGGPSITFQGANASPAQVVQAIQAAQVPYQAVQDARTALTQAIATRREADAATKAFLDALMAAITAAFGVTSTVFTQFGFKTRKKPAALTSAAKVVKAEKSKATRAARGTLGSKQRKAVRGDVTTPVTIDPTTKTVEPASTGDAGSDDSSPAPSGNGTAQPSSGNGAVAKAAATGSSGTTTPK